MKRAGAFVAVLLFLELLEEVVVLEHLGNRHRARG